MNPETGEIRKFKDTETLKKTQESRVRKGFKPLIELDKEPDPNCKECFGRGWIGKDVDTEEVIPCKCVLSDSRREYR